MLIKGLQKLTLLDFPGIMACTVFTGGCNFRCPFCHNASLALSGGIELDQKEIFEFLEKRKGLLDGVCISGGEPTLQHDLEDFVKKIKDMGFKVKLDTNGTNPKAVKSLIEKGLVDYIAMDVKNSPHKYSSTIGNYALNIDDILATVNIIKNSNTPHEFRTTIISEFHTEEDMKLIADIIAGCDGYFIQHYVDRDSCISHGFTPVDRPTAEKWLNHFNGKAKRTALRGY